MSSAVVPAVAADFPSAISLAAGALADSIRSGKSISTSSGTLTIPWSACSLNFLLRID
jgi:hypothetical protein